MNPAPMPARPSDPVGAARHDLVMANRILSSESVGLLDVSGHVSIRNPMNPNSYFVATVAPGSVTDTDIVERDFTKGGPDTMGLSIDDEATLAAKLSTARASGGQPSAKELELEQKLAEELSGPGALEKLSARHGEAAVRLQNLRKLRRLMPWRRSTS